MGEPRLGWDPNDGLWFDRSKPADETCLDRGQLYEECDPIELCEEQQQEIERLRAENEQRADWVDPEIHRTSVEDGAAYRERIADLERELEVARLARKAETQRADESREAGLREAMQIVFEMTGGSLIVRAIENRAESAQREEPGNPDMADDGVTYTDIEEPGDE